MYTVHVLHNMPWKEKRYILHYVHDKSQKLSDKKQNQSQRHLRKKKGKKKKKKKRQNEDGQGT